MVQQDKLNIVRVSVLSSKQSLPMNIKSPVIRVNDNVLGIPSQKELAKKIMYPTMVKYGKNDQHPKIKEIEKRLKDAKIYYFFGLDEDTWYKMYVFLPSSLVLANILESGFDYIGNNGVLLVINFKTLMK